MFGADQVHLIRKSFTIVERHPQVAALVFYQRLFELDPDLRPLFKNDIEVQAVKLMDMLRASIAILEKPDLLASDLEQMGARHAGYGVQPAHYETVGVALLAMLENVLGKEWNAATRQAWVELYEIIAETMLRGASRAAIPSPQP